MKTYSRNARKGSTNSEEDLGQNEQESSEEHAAAMYIKKLRSGTKDR